jgi:hypothetical protein
MTIIGVKEIMKRIIALSLIGLAIVVSPAVADPSLSWSGGGIIASDGWANSGTSITWAVQQEGSMWRYTYEFNVSQKEPSHIIFEVSDTFTMADFLGFGALNEGTSVEVGTWTGTEDSGDNPYMPGSIKGIKFELSGGTTPWVIDFYSTRSPMWGDFYAKDGFDNKTTGEWATAWNAGFETELLYAAKHDLDLSPGAYILVPNTVVPVPGAVLLGFLGLGYAGMRLRREV